MEPRQLVGILGLVAIAACWAFAVVLYRVGPEGSVARKLSLLLFVEGFTLLTAGFPELTLGISDQALFNEHPVYLRISFIAHTVGDSAMLALYPPFLAAALQTKLTRPFAGEPMRIGLLVLAAALVFVVQLSSLRVGATVLYFSLSLLFGFALVASIHAWHIAAAVNRARARSFALAFGLRDICWGFSYGVSLWLIWIGAYMTESETDLDMPAKIVYALGTLLCVPLVAYGILRSHLFDIDLRLRWTIKQSTLAAVIVTIIFVISEGADRLLSAELGNVAGLFAAAAVVFFLAPLQRLAESVAAAAMPHTQNTPEYAAFRKMQVYEEAVMEAHFEGGISDKERSLLNRLRDSLAISESDATAIEADIVRKSFRTS